ncbi:MAG: hypothetical protein HQM02_10210 [Magnetococcales bacterium]|nr:hypothetical protein [Magnetococcales bacterium]
MTTLEAGLRLDFVPRRELNREPFVLQTVTDRGSQPIQVRPMYVPAWTRDPREYADYLEQALVMEVPGRRRVRLYCSRTLARNARLLVLGGTHQPLGRRQEPLLEILTWVRANTRRLRFCHDQPAMRIVDHTLFYNALGEETSLPDYDQESGTFHHPQEVTGAVLVEYFPGFSLYDIEYDTGAGQIPAEWFREIRLSWLAGNIHHAAIPPVRVIALGPQSADQLSFPRDFWPEHASVRTGYRSSYTPQIESTSQGYKVTPQALEDPCWRRCKELVQPDGSYLTAAEMQAIRDCVQAEKTPKYHYVEESRTIRVERVTAPDNPEIYLDVARPVELVMRLKRADGGVCDNQAASGCCPELRLRFSGGA